MKEEPPSIYGGECQTLTNYEHSPTNCKFSQHGDCHEYLAAIFTHYWRNLAYRHTYLAKPYFVL